MPRYKVTLTEEEKSSLKKHAAWIGRMQERYGCIKEEKMSLAVSMRGFFLSALDCGSSALSSCYPDGLRDDNGL